MGLGVSGEGSRGWVKDLGLRISWDVGLEAGFWVWGFSV